MRMTVSHHLPVW